MWSAANKFHFLLLEASLKNLNFNFMAEEKQGISVSSQPTSSSETKPEVSSPTGGEKKGGKGYLIALLVVIVIVVLIIIGGIIFWKVAGKKIIKEKIEKIPSILEQGRGAEGTGIGSKIKEGIEQTQKGITEEEAKEEEEEEEETLSPTKVWPADLPNDLPKFKLGRLKEVGTMTISGEGKTWTLEFEKVETGASDKYLKELEDKGWTTELTYSVGDDTMIQASKGKWGVQFGVDSENKTAGLTIFSEE